MTSQEAWLLLVLKPQLWNPGPANEHVGSPCEVHKVPSRTRQSVLFNREPSWGASTFHDPPQTTPLCSWIPGVDSNTVPIWSPEKSFQGPFWQPSQKTESWEPRCPHRSANYGQQPARQNLNESRDSSKLSLHAWRVIRMFHALPYCCCYLCPTLCNPRDGSPPGSPVPGSLQARTLEWVAISFSNAWKWKVKVKSLSRVWLLGTPWTAAHQAPPSMGFSRQE